MSVFSQVKIQIKIFGSPTGLLLFRILIFRMACHVPVTRLSEITCENQNFSMSFDL